MRVYGIDFTSRPSRRKPLTCVGCSFDGHALRFDGLEEWHDFADFETELQRPGSWIAGIDFPFGQSRRFVETIGWPMDWRAYVTHAASLGREGFCKALDDYRGARPAGDREHRRQTDIAAGSISPQKLYGVPVGLMFFEGAPRLIRSPVTIPHMQAGDPTRIVVEAYPGVLARGVIGRRGYKQDSRRKQTDEQRAARRDLLTALLEGRAEERYGFSIQAPDTLADDPGGDHLDAFLCAIQAAWACQHRERGFGAPTSLDMLEGWIADPSLADQARPWTDLRRR